jgi:HKD family nuclease
MDANFLPNSNEQLLEALKNRLRNSNEIFFTSAFGSVSGFDLIRHEFSELMARAGSAKFCFDITQGMTSPDLIEELATYPGECSVKICITNQNKAFLHSKVYLFEGETYFSVIIGSSNFSRGGLKKNLEANIEVFGEKDKLYNDIKSFSDEIWRSMYAIDPIAHPDIFESYKELYNKRKKNEFAIIHAPIEIANLADQISNLNKDITRNSTEFYYLLGAITGNTKYQDIEAANTGQFKFRFHSKPLNDKDQKDKGFITNVVDGKRLGDIRLPQTKTMKSHLDRIVSDLKSFAVKFDPEVHVDCKDNTKKELNITVQLMFKNNNPLWDGLLKYVIDGADSNGKVVAYLPEIVKSANKEMGIHFVRGYADFRSRLSHADRTGTNGKLRIAFQIDTGATSFLRDLGDFLVKSYGLEVNVNDGSSRGKDHMLRVTADGSMHDFFHSGWRKKMAYEFAKFNKSL